MDDNTKIIEYIRLIAPEFESVEDDQLELLIEFVKPMVSKEKFGKLYYQAMAYLVCHHLKTLGLGDDSGDGISIGDQLMGGSVSEGETSVSFGTGQSINLQRDAELALTIYGLKYLNLRRMVIVSITINGGKYV